MLKNFLKIALRNIGKHKSISFINIFGLAVSMACCLLIMLFVKDELSYDKFHKNANRIHRIVKDFVNDDGSRLPDATTPPALAPAMKAELPEVEEVTRIFPNWGTRYLFQYGDKRFNEEGVYRVDSNFFDVFTFPFIKGNPKTAFKNISDLLITESSAKKYFGADDPMGKILRTDLGELKVSGVLKDVPDNSHFHFDFLISIRKINGNIDANWGFYNFYTYAKLKEGTSINALVPKIQALYKRNDEDATNVFYSQPLTDIHLSSQLKWEMEPNSDRLYVYVFSVIALFLIIIACINYVNLTTARSSLRAKEIGIRKVTGAFRSMIIRQFLMESVLTALLALFVAIILAGLFLPMVNQLTGKHLELFSNENKILLGEALLVAAVVGLLAGVYPAIYLSSFKPVAVLKGLKLGNYRVFNLRKALVVFQFTLSIALISGAFVVIQQINYVQNAKLGINKEQVMVIEGAGRLPTPGSYEGFKNDLLQMQEVKKLAGANGVIGGQNWTTSLNAKGSENSQLVNFLNVGIDFLDVMGIKIKEGRGFSRQFMAGDSVQNGDPTKTERQSGSIILNERAVKDLALGPNPVGKQIEFGSENDTTYYLTLIGIVKDFHFSSLRNEIKPFAFFFNPSGEGLITVKLESNELSNTIAQIEQKWNKISPDRPFRYFFIDETFAKLYKAEEQFKKIFIYITTLAIMIACLGLFGLATFVTEQRTKEIGIRKVLGASVSGLVSLLSKDFVKLVGIAVLVATPFAWWLMNNWLQDFAYRIQMDWWVFVLAGLVAVFIALATISFQAIKAAIANPVKSLRSE